MKKDVVEYQSVHKQGEKNIYFGGMDMDYEIEFKMVEIKDLSKIQRSVVVEDHDWGTNVTETQDLSDEYCKDKMKQVENLFDSECQVKYEGCIERIGNYVFNVLHSDTKYKIVMQLDTYEWHRQITVKIGYLENYNIGKYDKFLEKLKICIKNKLIRDWYNCVWMKDTQSLELSREVYSDIYMAENELRAFVSRVMIEHFGIEWYDRPEFYKLKASIQENEVKVKRNVPNFNNIDVSLYTVTLEKLMDTVQADIYSDLMQDTEEIQREIKEKIFSTTQLDKMQGTLDFLRNRYVKKYNIWEKYFKPLISDDVKWDKLRTTFIDNRNHVAHNKLLDYSSKETMIRDTDEFRKMIKEADIKFDTENCSEEIEETLQAIAEKQEYERETQLEIVESEAGVRIRDRSKIMKLFQDTIDDIYTMAEDKTYFDEEICVDGNCVLKETLEKQLLFSITGKNRDKLEVYYKLDIDDSAGAASVMQIIVYEATNEILKETAQYVNGEAEYNSEQTNYMAVVMDEYNDSCANDIKNIIEDFIKKQREESIITCYEKRKAAEDDWSADAADTLENN